MLGDLAIKFSNSDSHPLVQALKGEVQSHAQMLDKLVKLLLQKIQSYSYKCIYMLELSHYFIGKRDPGNGENMQ